MIEHNWELCIFCGPMVVCGYCGNSCCNGGTRDNCGCKEAYAIQDKGVPKEVEDEWELNKDRKKLGYASYGEI